MHAWLAKVFSHLVPPVCVFLTNQFSLLKKEPHANRHIHNNLLLNELCIVCVIDCNVLLFSTFFQVSQFLLSKAAANCLVGKRNTEKFSLHVFFSFRRVVYGSRIETFSSGGILS